MTDEPIYANIPTEIVVKYKHGKIIVQIFLQGHFTEQYCLQKNEEMSLINLYTKQEVYMHGVSS